MDARLRGISIQPDAIRVTGEAVHDGPAGAAILVDLEAQVIVRAGHGVVMLVDDKVRAVPGARVCLVQGRV